jgi:hypothetical protein
MRTERQSIGKPMTMVLAIGWRQAASFQEKLRQLLGK